MKSVASARIPSPLSAPEAVPSALRIASVFETTIVLASRMGVETNDGTARRTRQRMETSIRMDEVVSIEPTTILLKGSVRVALDELLARVCRFSS